ncbi:MAG TPA: PAS domain-containing protein, partial [Thermoanaerobaculia bacterium]
MALNLSTRKSLWTAFGFLFVFVTLAATLNIFVLQKEKQQYVRVVQVYEPLVEAIMSMDGSVSSMLAAARGFTVTERSEFLAQYDEAIRNFETTAAAAADLATQRRDRELIEGMRIHFQELKELSDKQIRFTEQGYNELAEETMLEAARSRRGALDFAGAYTTKERNGRAEEVAALDGLRLTLTLLLIGVSIAILALGGVLIFGIEKSLNQSLARQIRRTEAMIAGMADGVMLVDEGGEVVFINPAGVQLLGQSTV